MSLAKKCDRCGILYEPKDINIRGTFVNGLGLIISRDKQNDHVFRCKYFDLCPECLTSLADWFKNEPVCLTFNDIRRAVGLKPIGENDKDFTQLHSEKEIKDDQT